MKRFIQRAMYTDSNFHRKEGGRGLLSAVEGVRMPVLPSTCPRTELPLVLRGWGREKQTQVPASQVLVN